MNRPHAEAAAYLASFIMSQGEENACLTQAMADGEDVGVPHPLEELLPTSNNNHKINPKLASY